MKKPKFNIGDRVRLSDFDSPSKKGYKHQFTQDVFEIFAISSRKPPTYTKKDEQDKIMRGNFFKVVKILQSGTRSLPFHCGYC